MLATIIIGILAFTTLLGFGLWVVAQSLNRAARDPRYLRRIFVSGAVFYVVVATIGIVEVATREEPVQALIDLPISLMIIWIFLRAVAKTKAPPGRR